MTVKSNFLFCNLRLWVTRASGIRNCWIPIFIGMVTGERILQSLHSFRMTRNEMSYAQLLHFSPVSAHFEVNLERHTELDGSGHNVRDNFTYYLQFVFGDFKD